VSTDDFCSLRANSRSVPSGLPSGIVRYQGLVSAPPSLSPTLFQLDLSGALTPAMLPVVLIFFLLALFDSVGTLVAIGMRAGLMKNGELPRAREALLADAMGTVVGAAIGTSTVTAYVESGAGVAAGGRTGLAALVTATLFLFALFGSPLVRMIGAGYARGPLTLYPVIAPPLILEPEHISRFVELLDQTLEAIHADQKQGAAA